MIAVEGDLCRSNRVITRSCVAIISADEGFLKDIAEYLSKSEFLVSTFTIASKALTAHLSEPYDIVITEFALPDQNTLGLVRQLAFGEATLGILILSSYADEIERVVALELGADDVVTKSISSQEILARIRAISRRCSAMKSAATDGRNVTDAERQTNKDYYLGWRLDTAEATFTGPNGHVVVLSRMELQIIAALIKKPKVAFSRSQLSAVINRSATATSARHIDTMIARLRRKMEAGGGEMIIGTAFGVGYYCT